MKLTSERGVIFSHSETQKIFDRLRSAQQQIVNQNTPGCAWMSTAISSAIAYMALLEDEVLQLRIQKEILEARDEEEE